MFLSHSSRQVASSSDRQSQPQITASLLQGGDDDQYDGDGDVSPLQDGDNDDQYNGDDVDDQYEDDGDDDEYDMDDC